MKGVHLDLFMLVQTNAGAVNPPPPNAGVTFGSVGKMIYSRRNKCPTVVVGSIRGETYLSLI